MVPYCLPPLKHQDLIPSHLLPALELIRFQGQVAKTYLAKTPTPNNILPPPKKTPKLLFLIGSVCAAFVLVRLAG